MTIRFENTLIPGTRMDKEEMGNVTGLAFLDKVFYVQDGIMLAQIREIAGIDGSTLQNWVKRGWAGSAINKKYSKDQLARILIINMMRSTLQLEKIDDLLHEINGDLNTTEDDIIAESRLYDYACRVIDEANDDHLITPEQLRADILRITEDYQAVYPGAQERLHKALEVIVTVYASSLIANHARNMLPIHTEA